MQIPADDTQIWTLKKSSDFLTMTCNGKEVFRYDYDEVWCLQFGDFGPELQFPQNQKTAALEYKILYKIGTFKNHITHLPAEVLEFLNNYFSIKN